MGKCLFDVNGVSQTWVYGDPWVEGFPLLGVNRHTLVFRLIKIGVNDNVSNVAMALTLFEILVQWIYPPMSVIPWGDLIIPELS